MENREEIRSRITPEKFGPYAPVCNLIIDNMGYKHLDFGCGTGFLASLLSRSTNNQVIGYDFNPSIIEDAKRVKGPDNLTFTAFKEKLQPLSFDSIDMTFVFHEGKKEVLKEASSLLKFNGKLVVIDYNLKDYSFEDFIAVFTLENELKEAEQMGKENAWLQHTSMGLSDCQEITQELGFTTLKAEPLEDNSKYFVWVGQKHE